MRLPVPGEDVGNRSSGLSDDQLIHVDEGTVEEFRQSSCDLRLAAAGHADEEYMAVNHVSAAPFIQSSWAARLRAISC